MNIEPIIEVNVPSKFQIRKMYGFVEWDKDLGELSNPDLLYVLACYVMTSRNSVTIEHKTLKECFGIDISYGHLARIMNWSQSKGYMFVKHRDENVFKFCMNNDAYSKLKESMDCIRTLNIVERYIRFFERKWGYSMAHLELLTEYILRFISSEPTTHIELDLTELDDWFRKHYFTKDIVMYFFKEFLEGMDFASEVEFIFNTEEDYSMPTEVSFKVNKNHYANIIYSLINDDMNDLFSDDLVEPKQDVVEPQPAIVRLPDDRVVYVNPGEEVRLEYDDEGRLQAWGRINS